MANDQTTLNARVDVWICVTSSVIAGLICSPILLMTGVGILSSGYRPSLDSINLAECAVCIVFLGVWLRSFRIVVQDATLYYSSLFTGTRRLGLHEIASVKNQRGARNLLGPFGRLVIEPLPSTGKAPITINEKAFSRRDLHRLHAILSDGPALPRATDD